MVITMRLRFFKDSHGKAHLKLEQKETNYRNFVTVMLASFLVIVCFIFNRF